MILLKFLLLPFSFLYGIIMAIRNQLYDSGIFPSAEFDRAVIVIGNLTTGGTGKSPMTEYLFRLISQKSSTAILSRGYGRKTSGFQLASPVATAEEIGDEPAQFKKKFPHAVIAADANRVHGIKTLLSQSPELKVFLLDDAFQHRRIKPGLSILLTEYSKMYYDDHVLPAGSLREFTSGKKRADVIVVTKCPANLTPVEKRIVVKKINPEPHQQVYFGFIKYGMLQPFQGAGSASSILNTDSLRDHEIVLLTGIANPIPLADHLKPLVKDMIHQSYPDHHDFSLMELETLKSAFQNLASDKKLIVTTEKDAMRLDRQGLREALSGLPVYFLPIEIDFEQKEKEEFNKTILDYVFRTDQKNSRVH